MSVPEELIRQVLADAAPKIAGPKRGVEIFEGVDYPRTWDGFIGQEEAKEQLRVAVGSAVARKTRPEHTLFASGIAGVGKTTLATMAAFQAGAGFLQTSGPLSLHEFRSLVHSMHDGDVLFHDELHTLVAGNKNRADWVLPFLVEGKLYTERGAEEVPDIAFWGATTDAGKLPATILSRFMCTPTIERYTPDEAAQICGQLAKRMDVNLPPSARGPVSQAADGNPRLMRKILTAIRDLGYAYPETHPNLEKAFRWSGVSADGLSQTGRDILILLYGERDYTSSVDTLKGKLGEPGPIVHHEQALMQRALLTITGRGRKLTDAGVLRAREEAIARS